MTTLSHCASLGVSIIARIALPRYINREGKKRENARAWRASPSFAAALSSRFNAWESVENERGPKSGTDSCDSGNESGEI